MRVITQIKIHCADTPNGVYFDRSDIYQWHVNENGWKDIGYHYIVLLDGTVEKGRPITQNPAGVKGYNTGSIDICYIGGMDNVDTRTPEQKESIKSLLSFLRLTFGEKLPVYGHRDFTDKKYCPSYDAKKEHN